MEDGRLLWRSEAAYGVPNLDGEIVNAFEGNIQIDIHGRIYAGCDNDYIYCYDYQGKLIWAYKTNMMVWSCGALDSLSTRIFIWFLVYFVDICL